MNSARPSSDVTSDERSPSNELTRSADASDRLRILLLNSTLHIGGAEQVAANLARHLDRRRFEVTACYLKENGVVGEQMLRAGVDLVPVPGLKNRRDYFTSLKLRKLVRARRIQLLHSHDLHSFIDASMCRLMTPSVRHVHTLHFGNYPHIPAEYARIERLLWRVPDTLIAVGHEQAAAIRSMYGIPPRRLHVIWNGTDAPATEPAADIIAQLPHDGTPVIGSISTLIPQKGLPDLLQAAAILRSQGRRFMLLLAGEGKLRAELEEQARQLDLDQSVRFLGWVKEASKRVLPCCDIFVQSSHWEAMSVVVLEAMAAGKPIAVTTVGENVRVVVDEQSGLLVPPRNPQMLATALARLLEDPELRARLGTGAKRRYEEYFTVQHMVRNHERLYAQLLGAPAAALDVESLV